MTHLCPPQLLSGGPPVRLPGSPLELPAACHLWPLPGGRRGADQVRHPRGEARVLSPPPLSPSHPRRLLACPL